MTTFFKWEDVKRELFDDDDLAVIEQRVKEMVTMMRDGCWHMKTGNCTICNEGG